MNPIASWMLFAFVVVGLHQLLRRCLIPGFERAGKVIDQARADVDDGNPHTGRPDCHCTKCDRDRWLAAVRDEHRHTGGRVQYGIDHTKPGAPRNQS